MSKINSTILEGLQQEGGAGDIETLEVLLSFAMPNKDAQALSARLINSCGSLSAVFEAPYSLLLDYGASSNQAVLIKLIPSLSRKYLDDKYYSEHSKRQIPLFKNKIIAAFIGAPSEKVILVLRDAAETELYFGTLSKGSVNASEVYTKQLIELAIQHKAASAILAHNHPSGIPYPSRKDIESTIKIKNILKSINIRLENHFIVAGNQTFSMAESEEFYDLFI